MRLFPKLKLSPNLARMAHSRLLKMAYRFVDLEAESSSPDSRVIEYSFVISKLAHAQRGKVLDVGCTDSGNIVPLVLASLGWEVYGIDIREFKLEHTNFHFIHGDVRDTAFPDKFFDYVYAVSTLEHIGLKGRYSVTEEDYEGDIKAVREIARVLRPDGTLLVTVPYGKGQSVKPLQRVYNEFSLQRLFSGWRIIEEIYYTLKGGYWVTTSKEMAAQADYLRGRQASVFLELTTLK